MNRPYGQRGVAVELKIIKFLDSNGTENDWAGGEGRAHASFHIRGDEDVHLEGACVRVLSCGTFPEGKSLKCRKSRSAQGDLSFPWQSKRGARLSKPPQLHPSPAPASNRNRE
jgi:hypothetical protein